jgi:aspartate/glutamate racemase
MKTIGVLGGMGPQATTDFVERLHRAAHHLIPPAGNTGYPPLVVYYIREMPIITGGPGQPARPNRKLLESVMNFKNNGPSDG